MSNWKDTFLKPIDTLTTAINVLDKGAKRIALVVDDCQHLLGTITDGDIRRALLKYRSMETVVTDVMQHKPTTSLVTDNHEIILSKMKNMDLLQMPLLDEKGRVVGLKTIQNLMEIVRYDNPVVLMAGGFGTRLYPLTKHIPKPLLKIGQKPILESIFNQFVDSGFHDFFISTHYKADMVKEHFGDGSKWGVNIRYIHEKEPLGTAGALGLLPNDLPDLPLIIMNGDLVTKVNFEYLLSFHNEQKGVATMCVHEYDFQIPYGVIEINEHRIKSIVEKPTHSFFVNAGIYILEPELVAGVKKDVYLDMPALLERQLEMGKQVTSFPIHEYWLDIGLVEEYERAKREVVE